MRFHCCLVHPPDRPHVAAFAEMIECVHDGLIALGHHVTMAENAWEAEAVNIFFGAHHLAQIGFPRDHLPRYVILYNFEPQQPGIFWDRYEVVQWFAQYPVWDYSLANAAYRNQHAWPGRWYTVPIGYTPRWTRIHQLNPSDRDVLFYGSLTDRRIVALDSLDRHGLAVQTLFGVYGSERDAWIARSRLVLNLHQVAGAPFEAVRVAYLLANRCAVVAEGDPAQDEDAQPWAEGLAWTTYDDISGTCQGLLADGLARHQLAEQGYQLMQQRSEARYLEQVLDQMATDHLL